MMQQENNKIIKNMRLQLAHKWLLLFFALLAISLWVGSIADAKADEASNSPQLSSIWSQILKGKSIHSAMTDAGFCFDANKAPTWALEVCSEDLIPDAYIDNDAGILSIKLQENADVACAEMKAMLTQRGWIEIETEDEVSLDAYTSNSPTNTLETTSSLLDEGEQDAYVLSFIKEKGETRWLTMECAQCGSGTNIVLHTKRI